jgi:oligopeptide/dipeptide ABC transporter ATP-binding protein
VSAPPVPLLVEAVGLTKHFAQRRGLLGLGRPVRAVEEVDLAIRAGECLALVGESGSGKSTVGRLLLRLIEPTAGRVLFRGEDLATLDRETLRRRRRHFQMVFQDPFGSLNPRMRIGATLAEPLTVHGLATRAEIPDRVAELLDAVGLPLDARDRFPHEFSGGQRQRIAIARALATGPDFLVADEPVSALDVSVRAQVTNLLTRLQEKLGLALLFVAHDLALVEHLADRVAVLYLGRLVETAPAAELFARPLHPYTLALLSAVPVPAVAPQRRRIALSGEPANPANPPPGCAFHPRCPIARELCRVERPILSAAGADHRVACHFPGELSHAGPSAAAPA